MDKSKLEDRKLKEIEHSKQRRSILQGFERISDTHAAQNVENLEELVKDKELFNYHFSNMKYYSITKASEDYKHAWLDDNCKDNTKILDFACGNGENGIYAASACSECLGIDIDPVGVANANQNAKSFSLSDKCSFSVMDGENMDFDDNTFDLAVEYGALHHVDLDKALSELRRVLKPNGKMMCIEALRHNPIIHAYRRRTPHLRTEWEVDHILGIESLTIMEKYFHEVNPKFFHLSSLVLVPLRKTFLFPMLLPVFDLLDRLLLSSKLIGKYGWIMAVELKNPRD